ncbi:DMT family transporter [Roseivivax sp. CAU 1761]
MAAAPLSENARGALLMMGAMAAFTCNDALVKRAGAELPLMQILVIRGAVASLAILLLAWAAGGLRRPGRRDGLLIALRSAAEIGATWFFLTALMRMPLANVTAILQTLPLTVTLAGALVFGETVGWRRGLAIAVGFAGMLLIVRPGSAEFDANALYAMAAVAFVTVRDLAVRRLSAAVPSLTVTLAGSLSVTLFAAALSAGVPWQPVPAGAGALVLGAAGFVIFGYLMSVAAMRVGEVAVVAPFRYTGLLWALGLGWALFGDWPRPLTLVGAALIAATGLFTLWREARARRRGGAVIGAARAAPVAAGAPPPRR